MTNNTSERSHSAEEAQNARAAYLSEKLQDERWTYRKLEARTGIKKGVISSRLQGVTPLTMGEIEVFADVLNRDPVELFSTLLAIPNGTTPVYDICPEIPRIGALELGENDALEHDYLAPVTTLGRAS